MYHKHHIIPKHMGGTDEPSNIIELTVEEHAEAHRILFEQHGRWQDYYAWQGLSGRIGKEELIHQIQSSRRKGKTHSSETKEKMAAAKRGKKISKEHAESLRQGRINSKNSPEHNEILRNIWLDKKLSDEHRDKISLSRKGKPSNNPNGNIDACKRNSASQKGKTWYKDSITGKRIWVL